MVFLEGGKNYTCFGALRFSGLNAYFGRISSRDVIGQESQAKVSKKKKGLSGKSGKVWESGSKVSKFLCFDRNVLKTILWL